MIAVLFGRDDFSAHGALRDLKAELDSDGLLAESTTVVDGASARPDELLGLCQTLPFLSARRVVVVEGLLARFEAAPARRGARAGRGRGRPSADLGPWEAFVQGLADLPESTALVFLEGELSPQNSLLAALRPLAQLREFRPLPQAELAAWINQRAQRCGVALEARAVALLAGLVGNQLWVMDSELQKLATYADGRPVTEEDVRSLVSLAREPSVFAMADATIEGRPQEAARLLQRLLAEGEPPQRLLFMVTRQYRHLLLAKELLDQRARPPEISARLQLPGFALQRLLQQAPAYTIERLRSAYHRLLEADLSIKRGIYDDETALQLLIFELAASAPARRSQGRYASG